MICHRLAAIEKGSLSRSMAGPGRRERSCRKLRERLSFANVMSVIAVCIALGGTAYAAKKISGKTIKNNTISKKKLKANVLKGLDTCPSAAPN